DVADGPRLGLRWRGAPFRKGHPCLQHPPRSPPCRSATAARSPSSATACSRSIPRSPPTSPHRPSRPATATSTPRRSTATRRGWAGRSPTPASRARSSSTTKLWNDAHAFDDAIAACEASLERLGLDYVDLYLVHWAVPEQGQYVDAWKALIALQERGLVRTIGVSNYPEAQLEEIIEATGAAPAIHQIELHPYFQQRELRAVHERHGILTEAWGPLGQGKSDLLENPAVTSAAEAHGASPAQVVLAWHLAHGIVTIPKSV